MSIDGVLFEMLKNVEFMSCYSYRLKCVAGDCYVCMTHAMLPIQVEIKDLTTLGIVIFVLHFNFKPWTR